ncbi:hypothetical protein A9Q76_02150 [Arcobacter sp. 31_11_sub10_T18]|nr:hypothetical protein A9Q76_02150 [Arcobacter sp. 31_11_sub10_T18]
MKPLTMINSLDELKQQILDNKAVLVYFSAPNCSVCEVLKPKIQTTFNSTFPNLKQIFMQENTSKEITSNYGIFSFPTILVFFEGKEFFRVGRNLSMTQFQKDIQRIYSLLFKENE